MTNDPPMVLWSVHVIVHGDKTFAVVLAQSMLRAVQLFMRKYPTITADAVLLEAKLLCHLQRERDGVPIDTVVEIEP